MAPPPLFMFDGGVAGPFPGPPEPPGPPLTCADDAVAPASAKPNPSAITPRYFFIFNSLYEDTYLLQHQFAALVPRKAIDGHQP
jgi:hypothetical protein